MTDLADAFDIALERTGRAYLSAEAELLGGGKEAAALLGSYLAKPRAEPFGALLVSVLLGWIEGKAPLYLEVLSYLSELPGRILPTPESIPRADGVAYYLSTRYKDSVAEMLAVRLAKGTDWPPWQVIAVLLYLEEQKVPSTGPALVRFAARSEDPDDVEHAVKILASLGRADLPALVSAEQRRLEDWGQDLPPALLALGTARP